MSGGSRPEVRISTYDYSRFSTRFLKIPPEYDESGDELVQKRVRQVVVRKGGFLLWQTTEKVRTPDDGAELICFVDGKSTRARAGILVHLTAPTIHSTWSGRITLEIVNLGPFDLESRPRDILIDKQLPGSFTNTPLDRFLKERNVDTVCIAGYMTQVCCDTTARQAFHRGYKVEFLRDATGTSMSKTKPVRSPQNSCMKRFWSHSRCS